MRVAISTLGCKSNQYDSSAIEETLVEAGLNIVPFPGPAEACIINTCTVTGRTDQESRQLIRKARKVNPEAVVIVTGCYAQVAPQEVSQVDGVDYVLGNPEKGMVLEYILAGRRKDLLVKVGDLDNAPLTLRARGSSGRTRAYLKIQDGCNNYCSYCIIPYARGRSRSLPLRDVLEECDRLVERGYREIVLTGIHLGAYGLDMGVNLINLLKGIEWRGYPCRFRLSSLDPDEVTDELIEIIAQSKIICNHLHLPLQSGDDYIIKGMNRFYTTSFFRSTVERFYNLIPGVSIGVDVIVGFPGEGERKFMNTYNLLKDLPIAYLHIFPFSRRKGTPAYSFKGQVNGRVIKERCETLMGLDKEKRRVFYEGHIGKRVSVLIEGLLNQGSGIRDRGSKDSLLRGRSRNYIPVYIEGEEGLKGREIDVIVKRLEGGRVRGER
ncbi:MAG: tRNA (N(6)-L-threonylcarbamoyladenosine(37)-C(2))-methylthiotransferase MtaB [Deltaproteobacteria bacterium]|nr:tRNA (N(6)-L-threonylcarbamoyladenosine(37)-C(2))-methylthiotransferase MtaB [Deltaproteobacteria bacterium]